MFRHTIKAFSDTKRIFIQVLKQYSNAISLTADEAFRYVTQQLTVIPTVNTLRAESVLQLKDFLREECFALSHYHDEWNARVIKMNAAEKDEFVFSDIFMVLAKHFTYLEKLEKNTPSFYKNVAYVLNVCLSSRYCYNNNEEVLSKLFKNAFFLYILEPEKYSMDILEKEISEKCNALKILLANFSDVEYEIEQDGIELKKKALVSIQQAMEKNIANLGGINFLNMLYKKELKPKYCKKLDRYRIHRVKTVGASIEIGITPVNYLVLTALKTLKFEEPVNADSINNEEKYHHIVKMAQQFLLSLDLGTYSLFEDIVVNETNISAYICNNMLYDKMVILLQYNIDFLLDVIKKLFYSFEDLFVNKDYKIKTYRSFTKRVLKSGKHFFSFTDLLQLTGISERALTAILADISIAANDVNIDFITISDHTNSKDFPLIKLNNGYYYLFDARISGVGFYRALYRQLDMLNGANTQLNRQLGLNLEKYIENLFKNHKYEYCSGKYSLTNGKEGECDVIIDNEDFICGLELKYTLLDNNYEVADDVSLFSTLGKGMIKAQRQLLRHRLDLMQQGLLCLTGKDKTVRTVKYDNRPVVSISMCLSEYMFLSNKLIAEKILDTISFFSISLRDSNRTAEFNSFYDEQCRIKKLLQEAHNTKLFGSDFVHIFHHSMFLSLQQIYLTCKLCKNKDVFIKMLNRSLHVTSGALDYYEDLLACTVK